MLRSLVGSEMCIRDRYSQVYRLSNYPAEMATLVDRISSEPDCLRSVLEDIRVSARRHKELVVDRQALGMLVVYSEIYLHLQEDEEAGEPFLTRVTAEMVVGFFEAAEIAERGAKVILGPLLETRQAEGEQTGRGIAVWVQGWRNQATVELVVYPEMPMGVAKSMALREWGQGEAVEDVDILFVGEVVDDRTLIREAGICDQATLICTEVSNEEKERRIPLRDARLDAVWERWLKHDPETFAETMIAHSHDNGWTNNNNNDNCCGNHAVVVPLKEMPTKQEPHLDPNPEELVAPSREENHNI
eukprot:TRINITY_DN24641_c0_g2_i4.p1 TRINITY_DN24641_c0_g2~~TRINITY_DN24641_c0_g2_i4.p1  ORF type:complete len:330 (-),score=80.19 TRINITY_DN24641_c0_g2_i4:371-1276(-)